MRLRADEGDAVLVTGASEALVLAQEAVAGMDRLRAGLLRNLDDLVAQQVGLARGRRAEPHRLVGHLHEARVLFCRGAYPADRRFEYGQTVTLDNPCVRRDYPAVLDENDVAADDAAAVRDGDFSAAYHRGARRRLCPELFDGLARAVLKQRVDD